MNDADEKKLMDGLGDFIDKLDAELMNFQKRAGTALKWWAADVKANQHLDAAERKRYQTSVVIFDKMVKGAKPALGDLKALYKDLSDNVLLARCTNAKMFRDKFAVKRLASVKAFSDSALLFSQSLKSVLGASSPYPGTAVADIKSIMLTLERYSHYYGEVRVNLGQL